MGALAIASIRLDGGTQSRAALSDETIADYAEAIKAGAKFPEPVVFHDGADYWLVDGFHRVNAFIRCDRKRIDCEVKQGTKEEAQWASLSVNREHDTAGLKRTNEDKRIAVTRALSHPKSSGLSTTLIGEHVGVSQTYVSLVRKQVSKLLTSSTEGPATVTGKDGKQYPSTKQKRAQPSPEAEQRAADVANDFAEVSGVEFVAPPKPAKWECEGCGQRWPTNVTVCAECAECDVPSGTVAIAEVVGGDMVGFDPLDALDGVLVAITDALLAWPREESLAPFIELLEIQILDAQQREQKRTKRVS